MSCSDNLATHKPNRDMWLKRHKNVHLHYTPTHARHQFRGEALFKLLFVSAAIQRRGLEAGRNYAGEIDELALSRPGGRRAECMQWRR
jgi:hypothetical protein